ncbi:MAG: DUF6569 family protein [Desulfuromonadales bacterium]
MENNLRKHITERIHLGDMAVHKELAVIPLLCSEIGGPDYITLKEGFANGSVVVSEVSQGGSVPELKVTNGGKLNVLMLDGEELAGAKQNRVLNTTILVATGASVIIPVSCTEQGRWTYSSPRFSDSGIMMSSSIRHRKNRSVSASLKQDLGFSSDQGEVWQSIEELHVSHGTSSGTRAMRDSYEARQHDRASYEDSFTCLDGQCGIAVMIKGRVAGIELVSRPAAYRQLHAKLIGSYAMDIPLAQSGKSGPAPVKVKKILDIIMTAAEKRFASVGLGMDCRYSAEELVGSALAVDDWYVHMAFFRGNSSQTCEPRERMSSMSRRKAYRSGSNGGDVFQ